MNKSQLIDIIAEQVDGVTKKEIDAILSAILDVIQTALAEGDKVTLVGFGTFEVRERRAREGRNPSNGAVIQIPAARVPVFAVGKLFKEKVKGQN